MKKYLLFTVLILSVFSLQAQNNSLGNNDPDAKKILDAVSAKFKTYKGVQSNFTYSVEDSKGKTQGIQKGTLLMKGSKYKITMSDRQIFSDGSSVWNYDKPTNEVTISKIDPSATTITPQKLFTNFYDKDFLYKLNGDKKVGKKTVQEIELTPVDKTKNFHKVYLYIDKAAKTIISTKVLDKSGNKFTYVVTTLNSNAAVTDAQFTFDKKKFPGVEEVDLR